MQRFAPNHFRGRFGRLLRLHPATLVALGFVTLITLGSGLLMLPQATHAGGIPLIDAVFTATSAACVTGLTVVDTGTRFTLFGQWVILGLIQIGGMGVMTVAVMLFQAIGRNVLFKQRLAMQEVFAHTPRADILGVVRTVVVFTLVVEAAGAALLYGEWRADNPYGRALFLAVFHAVSAFCNAGFSLYSDNMMHFRADTSVVLTLCALIVLGGIGFPVIQDLADNARARLRRQRARLTVQTKVVLVTSAILTAGGTVIYWLLEHAHTLHGVAPGESFLIALFQAVNSRTAGFNSVDIAMLNEATLAMMIGLMFFGASPGSCGGGVKTTTLALIVAFIWARVHGLRHVEMFKRTIPQETVSRSLSLTLMAVGLISVVLFLVLAEHALSGTTGTGIGQHFLGYLFESVSAFATVGYSVGTTATLSDWGKGWVILLMLVGRIGVLSFAYIIAGGDTVDTTAHAKENIMIG
ncbi:MAG: ATPase [Nitrospirae bacterium]|nr:ATPase [Nitrospirota bacterium]